MESMEPGLLFLISMLHRFLTGAVVGLGFLIGTFSHTNTPNGYKPTAKEQVGTIFWPILAQLIGLSIGYIIHTHI